MELWQKYASLVLAVKRDHREQNREEGHSFYHAYSVAQYARIIALSDRVGECAWVAGLCHNTDRIFKGSSFAEVARIVEGYISQTSLTSVEKFQIIEAVAEHSKKNSDIDSLVTVTLKDADRLANLDVTQLLRSGQFRPNIPVFDPRYIQDSDPLATFRDPKTLVRDIQHTLEWEDWLRLPKAISLARPKCAWRRVLLRMIEDELTSVGLYPCPSELLMD